MAKLTAEILVDMINEQIKTNTEQINKFRNDVRTTDDVDLKPKLRNAIFTLQENNRILKNLLR